MIRRDPNRPKRNALWKQISDAQMAAEEKLEPPNIPALNTMKSIFVHLGALKNSQSLFGKKRKGKWIPQSKKKDKLKEPGLDKNGRRFIDSRSRYNHRTGCTVLYGVDLERRRQEVYFNCNGYCQNTSHASDCPIWCGKDNWDWHHPRGRGAGKRDDLFTFCYSRPCHREWHRAKDLGLTIEMHETETAIMQFNIRGEK